MTESKAGAGVRSARDLQTLARGGISGLVGVATSGALQFVLVVVAARGLGANRSGVFLESVAFFTILSHFGELGANTGLVRTIPRYRALHRTGDVRQTTAIALIPVLAGGVIMGAATFAFSSELATILFHGGPHRDAVLYLRIFGVIVCVAPATTVALAGTRGFGTMVPYVWVQNIGLPALRLVLVAAAVALGAGTFAVGASWALPTIAGFGIAMFMLRRLLRQAEERDQAATAPRPTRELASEFWRFSLPRGLATILGITVTWMDIVLVGALRSPREAGIYAAVSRLAIVGAYALQAVGMAIGPQISELLTRELPRRAEGVYRLGTWWMMALTWPIYLSLAVFAPTVMRVFGTGFVAGRTALAILSLAMLVNLATGNVTEVLLMGGKSSWTFANACVSLCLNVTLNLILIPPFGMTGAAIAWAVSIAFVNLAPVVQVRVLLGLRSPFGRPFTFVALASGLCYGALGIALSATLGRSTATFAVALVSGSAVYLLLLWRFRSLLHVAELRQALQLRTLRPGLRPLAAPSMSD